MRRSVSCNGALVLSCSLAASGCLFGGGPDTPVDTVTPLAASAVLLQTDRLVFGDSIRMAVQDREAWSEVWSRVVSREPSATLPRPVDFETEMVLVAAAGRLDTGAQIRFDSVGVRGDRYVATVVTVEDCGEFTSDVYPLVMVRVERSDLTIRWVERRERTSRCG